MKIAFIWIITWISTCLHLKDATSVCITEKTAQRYVSTIFLSENVYLCMPH